MNLGDETASNLSQQKKAQNWKDVATWKSFFARDGYEDAPNNGEYNHPRQDLSNLQIKSKKARVRII